MKITFLAPSIINRSDKLPWSYNLDLQETVAVLLNMPFPECLGIQGNKKRHCIPLQPCLGDKSTQWLVPFGTLQQRTTME